MITMGNDEFILYIRKRYDCSITNDQLGRRIWERLSQLDRNAEQVEEDQRCQWNDGEERDFMHALRLPKTATQFSFDSAILPRLYAFLDQLGRE